MLRIDEDPRRDYQCSLFGPFKDNDNGDIRVFVQYRALDGFRVLSFMVQDADDDAWLNDNAIGIDDKYQQQIRF